MSQIGKISHILSHAGLLLTLLLVAWGYWPGIDGPSMLDDRSSVLVLEERDIEDARSVADSVLGDNSGPFGRPVSLASFVLERWFQDEVTPANRKAANIILHLVNGGLVYCFFVLLLTEAGYGRAAPFALVGAALWFAAPLYVSTVLYIVQRMAMLAATFMLMALISYIWFRSRFVQGVFSWWRFSLVPFFAVLAVFSKENGIVVLPIIALLELMWFTDTGSPQRVLRRSAYVFLSVGTLLVAAAFLLYPQKFLGPYAIREWTPVERVFTQARVLWDYVGQHYWPDVNRMGLYHDDIVASKGVDKPYSTLWSMAAWGLLVSGVLFGMRYSLGKKLGLCVLIFIVGHSTESSVLPLELYFEHRNYFPGIGLFLLPVVIMAEFSWRWPILSPPMLAWGGVAILLVLFQTSSQVQVWSSSELVRLNQVVHHPRSFRANADMASLLASAGALERALEYSAVAHEVTRETDGDHFMRNLALACTARRMPEETRHLDYEAFDSIRPLSSVPTFYAFVRMFQDGRCNHIDVIGVADALADVYLSSNAAATASANMYSVLGVLENSLGRWNNAYAYTALFLKLSPGNTRGQLMQLHFTTALGKVDEAAELKSALVRKKVNGELSASEEQTLSLYTEQ